VTYAANAAVIAGWDIRPGGGYIRRLARARDRRAADRAVLEHPPRRSTRFQPDDEAYLIGPYEELLTVLRRDRPTPQAPGMPDLARSATKINNHQTVRTGEPELPRAANAGGVADHDTRQQRRNGDHSAGHQPFQLLPAFPDERRQLSAW